MNVLQKKGIKTELIDARKIKLVPHHNKLTSDMQELKIKIENSDNIIIGMGCISICLPFFGNNGYLR